MENSFSTTVARIKFENKRLKIYLKNVRYKNNNNYYF